MSAIQYNAVAVLTDAHTGENAEAACAALVAYVPIVTSEAGGNLEIRVSLTANGVTDAVLRVESIMSDLAGMTLMGIEVAPQGVALLRPGVE